MHAKIENGSVVEYPISNIRKHLPNVSLPADLTVDANLPDGYAWVQQTVVPQVDQTKQKVVQANPILVNGRWQTNFDVRDLLPEELEQVRASAEYHARQERNTRLAKSDWTQVADAPVDRGQWAAYRQALRDIGAQPGFPFNVAWPTTPTV